MSVTYLHEGIEVVKTGRVASRPFKSGKVDELLEITPQNPVVGKWTKWVREADLYIVKGEPNVSVS
jgi:hypothetical protein